MDSYEFVGTHFLANYSQCNDNLSNIGLLKQAMCHAVQESQATILGSIDHVFTSDEHPSQDGYTGVFILSESHASIHTYPEKDSCFVDLFTCGTKCSYIPFDQHLRTFLQPHNVSYQVIKRDTGVKILDQSNWSWFTSTRRLCSVMTRHLCSLLGYS
jgi:S-adenosylmethionine decarboxylase